MKSKRKKNFYNSNISHIVIKIHSISIQILAIFFHFVWLSLIFSIVWIYVFGWLVGGENSIEPQISRNLNTTKKTDRAVTFFLYITCIIQYYGTNILYCTHLHLFIFCFGIFLSFFSVFVCFHYIWLCEHWLFLFLFGYK